MSVQMTISYRPIGTIYTPFKRRQGMPIQPTGAQGVSGRVEIDPAYEEGLRDLDGFSHVFLLYHLHLSDGHSLTVTPFMDDTPRGLFATRAPRRPNPIGLSVVRLVGVAGCTLHVENVDMVDGTPLLDLKPYIPALNPPDETVRIGWLTGNTHQSFDVRSDDRFI
jgi:tRNA-Thr(GGU) m(6)t(6)A37 methyltransferase TsaA